MARITVIRPQENGVEHTVLLDCGFNTDGSIVALAAESLPEKRWGTRFGERVLESTGENFITEGEDIELQPEEEAEARAAIEELAQEFHQEVRRLLRDASAGAHLEAVK